MVKRASRVERDPDYVNHLRTLNRERNRANYHSDPAYRAHALALSHARRADKLGVDEIGNTADLHIFLMERDAGICQLCFEPIEDRAFGPYDPGMPSADHVIPLSRGGIHSLGNLQLAHLSCNWSKGNRNDAQALTARANP